MKISENSVKNLEILLNMSRVFCKLVDLGSLMDNYLFVKKRSPLVPVTWSANGPSTMSQPGTSHQRGGGMSIMEELNTVVREGRS